MTFKIKDSLSVDGSVVIDQSKNITANNVTVNGTLTANGLALQPQLVSGTSIRTVNGTTLLGAGNIDVGGSINGILKSNGSGGYSAALAGTDFQSPLTSGTTIKTINGTSVLGSGNVAISEVPVQTGNGGKFLTTNGTTASWAPVSAINGSITTISADTLAVSAMTYVATAALTLTLPATPAVNDWVTVVNRTASASITVARNGSNIIGAANDISIDIAEASVRFVYADATNGWVIV